MTPGDGATTAFTVTHEGVYNLCYQQAGRLDFALQTTAAGNVQLHVQLQPERQLDPASLFRPVADVIIIDCYCCGDSSTRRRCSGPRQMC